MALSNLANSNFSGIATYRMRRELKNFKNGIIIIMNKYAETIAYYSCLGVALLISYFVLNYAGDLAYSGKQPIVWINLLAFFAVILLVLSAIFIRMRYKK